MKDSVMKKGPRLAGRARAHGFAIPAIALAVCAWSPMFVAVESLVELQVYEQRGNEHMPML